MDDMTARHPRLFKKPHTPIDHHHHHCHHITSNSLTSFPSDARSRGALPTSDKSWGPDGASFAVAASLFWFWFWFWFRWVGVVDRSIDRLIGLVDRSIDFDCIY